MIYEPAVIIAVVLGLVEVVKRIGLPSRFCPLLAVVIGVLASFISPSGSIGLTIMVGVIYGLSASGFYSGVKNTAGK